MARARFTKPEFFDNPVLARCSHGARLLFVATWQVADRIGVFEWDAAKLRKYAFGYEDVTVMDVENMLCELVDGGFLRWAEVDGVKYGLVVSLSKHQKFHVAEKPKYETIAKSAIWLSTVQAGCKQGADTVPAPTQQGVSTVPAPVQHRAVTVPESLILNTENGDGERRIDLVVPQAEATRQKRGRSPDEQARAKLVREAFHDGYQEFYGRELEQWGAPENAHVYHLLQSTSAEVLARKARAYFRWPKREVIDAGHPFMKHRWSFSATLSELKADLIAPERRALAAAVGKRTAEHDRTAQQQDQIARVVAQVTGGIHAIDQGPGNGTEQFGRAALRDARPLALDSGATRVGGPAVPELWPADDPGPESWVP